MPAIRLPGLGFLLRIRLRLGLLSGLFVVVLALLFAALGLDYVDVNLVPLVEGFEVRKRSLGARGGRRVGGFGGHLGTAIR